MHNAQLTIKLFQSPIPVQNSKTPAFRHCGAERRSLRPRVAPLNRGIWR